MATEHNGYDDLYGYDGYEKDTPNLLNKPDMRQPRQDSGVDFETMADAIHHEAVGTLFASREIFNVETLTQPGPEFSVFARYHTRAEQRREDGSHVHFIPELRQWLERFSLPDTTRTNEQGNLSIENEVSHRVFRKRSLSAHASKSAVPSQASTELYIDDYGSSTLESEDDETNTISLDEHLNLLLSVALPYSPLESSSEWEEIKRVREEYNSIERARATRVELERRSAENRERQLEISVKDWEAAERMRKRSESTWPSNELEASVFQELDHGARLYQEMSRMITYEDSRLYIVPRLWDFTDLPRRTRLYSNTYNLLRYLRRERSVVFLILSRLDDLRGGRSKQSEAAVAKEIVTLEKALKLRNAAEVDYLNLLCDFLDWAIAHTTLEFRDSTNGGPRPTRRNALTDDIPLAIVEDVIETEPELNDRYKRLGDLEQLYFPERFIAMPLPSSQPQCTPRGRQIPVRQPPLPQDGPKDDDHFSGELHFGERLTRTLPRSFNPTNAPLLRVQKFDPHPVPTLDKKMRGEPTSPVNPPESDYLRPPKPKRKLTLRMRDYPHIIEEYSPKPLVPLKLCKSVSAPRRHKFRTGLDVDEHTSIRLNPPGQFLTLRQIKRGRALQEPLTPDNIDEFVERHRLKDLMDLHRRQRSAQYDVLRNYHQLMREFSSRASTHWAAPTASGYGQWYDEDHGDVECTEAVLHLVNPDPSDNFREILDADNFKRIEDQRFFDELENQESFVCTEAPIVYVQDPATRVVGFDLRGSSNTAQGMGPAHQIEHIEAVDALVQTPSPPTPIRSVWWSFDASQGHCKRLTITVTEIGNFDLEGDASEGLSVERADLFQRSVSRAEHRVEDESEVNATEIESFSLDEETFHEPPEQAQLRVSENFMTRGVQGSNGVGADIANAETEEIATGSEDYLSSAWYMGPVERPPTRAQQIIERQPELTPEEIDNYDTEEEELRRQASSRTRRCDHASLY